MTELTMVGCRYGLKTVSLIRLVRSETSMGLRDAKTAVEELLSGCRVHLTFADEVLRDNFRQVASQLGVEFDRPEV